MKIAHFKKVCLSASLSFWIYALLLGYKTPLVFAITLSIKGNQEQRATVPLKEKIHALL